MSLADLLSPLMPLFQRAGAQYGLDPFTLAAIAGVETGGTFKPSLTSPAGAQGLMQLMPSTARGVGVSNPMDPEQSIFGGAKVLHDDLALSERQLGGQGWNALSRALMMYNNGLSPSRWQNPQTQSYPGVFLNYYNQIKQAMAPQPDPNGAAQGGLLAMGGGDSSGGMPPSAPAMDPGLLAMLQQASANDTGSA